MQFVFPISSFVNKVKAGRLAWRTEQIIGHVFWSFFSVQKNSNSRVLGYSFFILYHKFDKGNVIPRDCLHSMSSESDRSLSWCTFSFSPGKFQLHWAQIHEWLSNMSFWRFSSPIFSCWLVKSAMSSSTDLNKQYNQLSWSN